MMYTKDQLIEIARAAAVEHKIDPALFCALCERESNWQWDAVRYEPAFYSRYIVPQNLLSQTEAQMRAISWGLGQIMGQTARDFGYRGLNLSGLLDPVEGARYAAAKLAACLKSHTDARGALLAYNGGSNTAYPDLVLANYDKYKEIA